MNKQPVGHIAFGPPSCTGHKPVNRSEFTQLDAYLSHSQNGYNAIIQEILKAASALASSCGHAVGCQFSSCTCGAVEDRHAALTEMNRILRKYGKVGNI